jgi:hypothetical protein
MMTTLFNRIEYTLASLIDAIANGQLGLPDIQRPFVWKNKKVRDLFNSMYRGYPIGYLLLWETGVAPGTKQIGTNEKQLAPSRVIVDGQQRLTSLYAVIKGVPVVRENFTTERIEIAFNPLDGRFEVPDAAIRRDKRFIPSISAIWDPKTNLIQVASEYVESLRAALGELSAEEVSRAQSSLGRLHALPHFPFTALELLPQVDPEQVADIFVLINSAGKTLNQSDFILTLMSVFWDKGRKQLEDFSRRSRQPTTDAPTPFNHLFQPDPDQLLRAAIAVGFRRARLSAVYAVLRGRPSPDAAPSFDGADPFAPLKRGQAAVLNVQHWHDFLRCVSLAGYRTPRIISGETALAFAYALYLIGRTELAVEENLLRRSIARWLTMSFLTGRFTNAAESNMEFDLNRLRDVRDSTDFVTMIEETCAEKLTADFWSITLPGDLATAAAQSPSMFAYFAALNVLDARVLFSDHPVRDLMDPSVKGTRSSLERHHLFPVAHLRSIGIDDQREYNQIANFTMVEWGDNVTISDKAPSEYVPQLEKRFDAVTLNIMYRHHGLPDGWERMEFQEFLKLRRSLMARTIQEAFDALAGPTPPKVKAPSVAALVAAGESDVVEFKSTLRTNLHTGERDPKMEQVVLKTIAGFLNKDGGTLAIGIADDGAPIGLERDGFPNEDKMALHLVNLLKDRLGGEHAINVHPRFDDYDGVRVLTVECGRSKTPVFVKDGQSERFFVRYGPSTQELSGAQAQAYIKVRYP